MKCSTCNTADWDAVPIDVAIECNRLRRDAGFHTSPCPECRKFVWPWELPPPDLGPATGLRWVPSFLDGWEYWDAFQGDVPAGWVARGRRGYECVAFGVHQGVYRSLGDAARALVRLWRAVTGEP